MLRLAILALAVVGCLANVVVKDCHPSGKSVIVITNPNVQPYPPRFPGNVKVSVGVELKKPLDKFDLDVNIIKDVDGSPLEIPCIGGVGSCYYDDACSILKEVFPDGKCPEGLPQCTCPFKPQNAKLDNIEFTLPTLPAEIAPVVAGKYEIKLTLKDSSSEEVLSCHSIKLELAAN